MFHLLASYLNKQHATYRFQSSQDKEGVAASTGKTIKHNFKCYNYIISKYT